MRRRIVSVLQPRLPYRSRSCNLRSLRYFSDAQYVKLNRGESFIKAAKANREDECEAILSSGIDKEDTSLQTVVDGFGNSALMLCAQRDWVECIQKLIDMPDVNINHQNVFGSSALMCGASHGFPDTVRALLTSPRLDIDLISRYGQTALMKAVQAGKLSTFKLLVQAGADVNVKNKQGRSALDIAIEKKHSELIQELRKLQ